MTTETRVDAHIAYAVRYSKGSDACLKLACIHASKVVGKYDGSTQQIAKESKRHVSSVENWAHAYWLRLALLKEEPRGVRQLWRDLPPSHWWLAWDIHQAGYDALYYLVTAKVHGWSGREMMSEYKADREAGNAPLQFVRLKISIGGLLNEALTIHRSDLTPRQLDAAEALWDALTTEDK